MDVALQAVVEIVNEHLRRTRGTGPVTSDTPLLADGHLDSFGLAELGAELEKALGVALPAGALLPEDFESPRVLHQRLVAVIGA
jgi:acyl carrier protein